MMDRDELITAWIEHHARGEKASSESFRVWQALHDLTCQDPEAAWSITLALIREAPDDRVLADIAAGPLEDLIRLSHGILLARVETAARQDPKFRRCLTGVWFGTDTPSEVRELISRYTATVENPLR